MYKRKGIPLKWKILTVFLLMIIFFLTGRGIYAQNVSHVTDQEAGLATGGEKLKATYDKGKYLGDIYFMVEAFSANGDTIVEPATVPIYKGDSLADIFNYEMHGALDKRFLFRKRYTEDSSKMVKKVYSLENDLDTERLRRPASLYYNVKVTGIDLDSETKELQIPAEVRTYAQEKGINLTTKPTHINAPSVGKRIVLANGNGSDQGRWEAYLDQKKLDKGLEEYMVGKDVQPGSVFYLSYSILGDDRGYASPMSGKLSLIKELAKINSGNKFLYLEDESSKISYNQAIKSLKNLKGNPQVIEKEVIKLQGLRPNLHPNKPYNFAHYEGQWNRLGDFLLSNHTYTMKKGEELEVFSLDLPRASDQNQNLQREDLKIEPVLGGDKIEIRRDVGDKFTGPGKSMVNTKDGALYYVRGLEEGLVKLKISYPFYNGRPNYIYLYISNRDTDYSKNRLPMKTNLDDYTKYDVIHFNKENASFPLDVYTIAGATSTKAYANGKEVMLEKVGEKDLDGLSYDHYQGKIPLENFWTSLILSTEKDGHKSSKIYNIRTAYIEASLKDKETGGTAIQGKEAKITINGQLAPLPKIGKFYNPGNVWEYFSNMDTLGYLTIGKNSGKEWAEKDLIIPGYGTFHLTNGKIIASNYGNIGFMEIPEKQKPENVTIREKSVTSDLSDGLNRPQTQLGYISIPNLTFNVEKNSGYSLDTSQLIKSTTDKNVYRPGEKVTVKVHITDDQIKAINEKYKDYVVPKNQGQNQTWDNTKAINFGSWIYSSNIPGMEEIQSLPPVNNLTTDVTEKIRRLERLKEFTFTLPETTPEGTYKINGAFLRLRVGPSHGTVENQEFLGKMLGFEIRVEGDPIYDNKPKLEAVQMHIPEFIVPGLSTLPVYEESFGATIRTKTQSFTIHTKDEVESVKLESVNPRGQFKPQILEKLDGKTFKSERLVIGGGLNILKITLKDRENNERIYTFNLTNLAGSKQEGQDPEEKKRLEDLLELANKQERQDYTEKAWKQLEQAKRHGRTLLEFVDTATLEQLQSAIKDLEEALGNKGKIPGLPEDPDRPEDSNTGQNKKGEIERPKTLSVQVGKTSEEIIGQLPKTLLYFYPDGKVDKVTVQWRLNNFRGDKPGYYTALGFYEEPSTEDQNFVELWIEVYGNQGEKEENKIVSILPSGSVEKKLGENLALPKTAPVQLSNGSTEERSVYWDLSKYDLTKAGTYQVSGKVEGTNLMGSLTLHVKDNTRESQKAAYAGKGIIVESISTGKSQDNRKNKSWSSGYIDISGHWAEDVINEVTKFGYFQGVDSSHFAPNKKVSQGEFITVLGRMAGVNKQTKLDQAYHQVYYDWALRNGVVLKEQVQPEKEINRGEMADIYFKALNAMNKSLFKTYKYEIKDQKSIPKAYGNAVKSLVQAGYLKGSDQGYFKAQESLTRAELAQIIHNTVEK